MSLSEAQAQRHLIAITTVYAQLDDDDWDHNKFGEFLFPYLDAMSTQERTLLLISACTMVAAFMANPTDGTSREDNLKNWADRINLIELKGIKRND